MKSPATQPVQAPQPSRPKHLGPIAPSSVPACVPARMVNEVLYCERLMYLEWAQGEFADNAFTVEGRFVHRVADDARGTLPVLEPGDDGAQGGDAPPTVARSVWLSSEALQLTAKIDVVEIDGERVAPVEYKRGNRPEVPEGAYLPERAQLCAQVLLLREHGFRCDEAWIYFAGDRRRVAIAIDEALVETTRRAVQRARELAAGGELPPPLTDSPKCNGCSLIGICLPDEVTHLQREPRVPSTEGLRRLHPARDEKLPLYVQQQGGFIGLRSDVLRIMKRDQDPVEARIGNTSQVNLMGNVQISTPALSRLVQLGVPVSFFSYGGYYIGRLVGHDHNNIELRMAQFRAASDEAGALRLARGFVAAKIANCRTLLRRNHRTDPGEALRELRYLGKKVGRATSRESLLGLEGAAAKTYFSAFTGMLSDAAVADGFDLAGRNRRPPRDPVNALMSFCYGLLTKDLTVAASVAGLDPMLGFYHQPRFGRPALSLDLMEEFRPLVADSTVVSVLNNGIITSSDFVVGGNAVAIKPHARKRLILAYERRMDQLITHPIFGYRISYRRVLEVQLRLLGRHLLGELDRYPSFRTR